MIPCSEAVQRLWDYLEHEVSITDRAAMEEHLAVCRRCCGEVEFAHELRRVLAAAAEVELSPTVERHLTRALDELEPHPPTSERPGLGARTPDHHGGPR